jgi:predicted amidophosphoribosyltransferase
MEGNYIDKLIKKLENHDINRKYFALRYLAATLQRDPAKIAAISSTNEYRRIVTSVKELSSSPHPTVKMEAMAVLELLNQFDKETDDEETLSCPSCGAGISMVFSYCPKCGATIEAETSLSCQNCGKPVSSSMSFCPFCGEVLKSKTGLTCPTCNSERDVKWKICPFCGTEF